MIADLIPTYQEPYQSLEVALADEAYTLKLRWNDGHAFWVIDLYDRDESPILLGVKMVKGFPLVRRYGIASLPRYGDLVVYDRGHDGQEPTFDGLGSRFLLYYVDWTDDELARSTELMKLVQTGSIWDSGSSVWDNLSAMWPS